MPRRATPQLLYATVKKCIIEDGDGRTHIMYATNQSWEQIGRHLKLLKDIGWIEEEKRDKNTVYVATSIGRTAVEGFEQFVKQVPEKYLDIIFDRVTADFNRSAYASLISKLKR